MFTQMLTDFFGNHFSSRTCLFLILLISQVTTVYGQEYVIKKGPFDIAREFLVNEIDPLDLKNKTALDAFNAMLSDGYRCSIRSKAYFFENPSRKPMLECLKATDKEGCAELAVYYSINWDKTKREYVSQLNQARVTNYFTLCTLPDHFSSPEQLVSQDSPEKQLTLYVNSLHLNGKRGIPALEVLLTENFSCSIDVDVSDEGDKEHSKQQYFQVPLLRCTKPVLLTKISTCHQAVINLRLTLNPLPEDKKQLINRLDEATIVDISSSCEFIPY